MKQCVIKICGITRVKDACDAVSLGADFIGLNFFPGSPRFCTRETAEAIIAAVGGRVKIIGVFVDVPAGEIAEAVNSLGLAGVQLHGGETPEDCGRVKKLLPGKFVIKALRVSSRGISEVIRRYRTDFLLLDSFSPDRPGGTGIPLNTGLLEGEIPFDKVFLAGGITPENAAEYVRKFHPYGIDVASGVEERPGVKNRKRMELLIKNIRQAITM